MQRKIKGRGKGNCMGIIKNTTRKTIIAKDFTPCLSSWQKAKGLMFTLRMKSSLLFFFSKERRWGLHMVCVFYPIDVIFLDSRKKVVDLKEGFRPFTFYTPKNPCTYIIELPKGTLRKSKTSIGDVLEW
jgi:uncharacterized protein